MSNDDKQSLKAGDKVEWNGPGRIRGTVKKKLTEPMELKGRHVAASADNPQYVVQSDKTGEQAAHKPSALTKVSGHVDAGRDN